MGRKYSQAKKRLLNSTKNFFYSRVKYKNKLPPIMEMNKEKILGGDSPVLGIPRSGSGMEPSVVQDNEIQKYTIGQIDDPINVRV